MLLWPLLLPIVDMDGAGAEPEAACTGSSIESELVGRGMLWWRPAAESPAGQPQPLPLLIKVLQPHFELDVPHCATVSLGFQASGSPNLFCTFRSSKLALQTPLAPSHEAEIPYLRISQSAPAYADVCGPSHSRSHRCYGDKADYRLSAPRLQPLPTMARAPTGTAA